MTAIPALSPLVTIAVAVISVGYCLWIMRGE